MAPGLKSPEPTQSIVLLLARTEPNERAVLWTLGSHPEGARQRTLRQELRNRGLSESELRVALARLHRLDLVRYRAESGCWALSESGTCLNDWFQWHARHSDGGLEENRRLEVLSECLRSLNVAAAEQAAAGIMNRAILSRLQHGPQRTLDRWLAHHLSDFLRNTPTE
ncbi:MAG: hypothetical protein U0931_27415 [Vulcanimicrobiota bacterium]